MERSQHTSHDRKHGYILWHPDSLDLFHLPCLIPQGSIDTLPQQELESLEATNLVPSPSGLILLDWTQYVMQGQAWGDKKHLCHDQLEWGLGKIFQYDVYCRKLEKTKVMSCSIR